MRSRKSAHVLAWYTYASANPIINIDRRGLQVSGAACEFCKDVAAIGLDATQDALNLRYVAERKASEAANRLGYVYSGYMGEEDALRHCIWSCLITQLIGDIAATVVGTNHEDCNPSVPLDRSMDMTNNAIGVGLGRAARNSDCGLMCVAALDDGRLSVRQPTAMPGARGHR